MDILNDTIKMQNISRKSVIDGIVESQEKLKKSMQSLSEEILRIAKNLE